MAPPTRIGAQLPATGPPLFGAATAGRYVLADFANPRRLLFPFRVMLFFGFFYYASGFINSLPGMARFNPNQYLLLAAGGWFIIEKSLLREPIALSWPESHALTLFLIAGVLSASYSFWPGEAVRNTQQLAKGVLVYLLILNSMTSRDRLRAFLWALALGGGIAGFGVTMNHFNGVTDMEGRAIYAGPLANSNDIAMGLIVVVPLAMSLVGKASVFGRILIAAIVGIAGLGIFFTYSRQGIIGLATAVIVMMFRGATPELRNTLIVVGVVLVLAFPAYSNFWEREEGFTGLQSDSTFQNRIASIKVGWELFNQSPIVGIGLGCSYIGYYSLGQIGSQHYSMIHNTYVQALAEVGLLGTLLFAVFAGFGLLHVHRIARQSRADGDAEMTSYAGGVESSIAGLSVVALAGPFLIYWLPYFLIAISSAMRKLVINEAVAAAPGPEGGLA